MLEQETPWHGMERQQSEKNETCEYTSEGSTVCSSSMDGGNNANASFQPDCMSACSKTSDDSFADPSQTLIFLDWDDTLFPTTEIFDRWGLPKMPMEVDHLNNEQLKSLDAWRCAVYGYLSTISSLSDGCVIITNSRRPWVEECIDRFAPNLKPLFASPNGPRVVYAREIFASDVLARRKIETCVPALYTSPSPATPEERHDLSFKWKAVAMQKEAEKFYSKRKGQTWKNIISSGDMPYEHDAAQELSFRRLGPASENLRIKTLRLPEAPSISAMSLGMSFGCYNAPLFVNYNGDIDLDLNAAPDRLSAVAKALQMPELYEQAPKEVRKLSQQSAQSEFPLSMMENEALLEFRDLLTEIVHDYTMD